MEFSSTLRFPPHINESESPVTILSSSVLSFAGTASSPAFPHSIVSALAVNSAGFTLLTIPPAAPDGHLSSSYIHSSRSFSRALSTQNFTSCIHSVERYSVSSPSREWIKNPPIPAFLNPSICSPRFSLWSLSFHPQKGALRYSFGGFLINPFTSSNVPILMSSSYSPTLHYCSKFPIPSSPAPSLLLYPFVTNTQRFRNWYS